MSKLAYSISEAAESSGQSMDTIKRALRATDPKVFPPPLRAKRAGAATNSKRLILATELQRWLDSLPDA